VLQSEQSRWDTDEHQRNAQEEAAQVKRDFNRQLLEKDNQLNIQRKEMTAAYEKVARECLWFAAIADHLWFACNCLPSWRQTLILDGMEAMKRRTCVA
jgi:hypothetical protein